MNKTNAIEVLGYSYVYTVASAIGCNFDKLSSTDNDSVDVHLSYPGRIAADSKLESPEVKLQGKRSASPSLT